MKHRVALTVASLLSILFSMVHLAQDVVHGMSPGGLSNLTAVLVLAGWLYATLVLAERRSGQVVILVMSLLASGLPVIHMIGSGGITGGIKSGEALFFAWNLLALGVTAVFSVILSAQGLWGLQRRPPT